MINKINLYSSNSQIQKFKSAEKRKESNYRADSVSFPNHFYYVPFFGRREVSRVSVLSLIQNANPYSETGYKGTVYKLASPKGSYAVKVARTPEFSFEKEAEVLKKVPDALLGSQKFVDFFKDPKTNKDVLVSTFAKGRRGVLYSEDDFKTFFKNLLLLDINGIYHGDLNMENCLFDEGNINLIDFGEGSFFKIGDTYSEMYPTFMLKSNACNLEQNGIPDCIKKWNDMGFNLKNTFKKYLQAKGEFYQKHSALLDESVPKYAVKFEQNLAKVLLKPSDDIIENELRRIDLLYTFEHADTAVNYQRIPEMGTRNWNLTIEKAISMLSFINQTLRKDLGAEERIYFEFQKQTAEKLLETFLAWGNSTKEWINESMKKDFSELSQQEKDFRKNQGKYMELPPDLFSMVMK